MPRFFLPHGGSKWRQDTTSLLCSLGGNIAVLRRSEEKGKGGFSILLMHRTVSATYAVDTNSGHHVVYDDFDMGRFVEWKIWLWNGKSHIR